MSVTLQELDVALDRIFHSIYNKEIYDPEYDVNATVSKIGDTVYVSFRPTIGELGSKNWKTNFDFLFGSFNVYSNRKKNGKCKVYNRDFTINVHSGFRDAFLTLAHKIRKKLNFFEYSNVVFVGHSLGGAMATLAYFWFDIPNSKVITTGCPRFLGFISSIRIPKRFKKHIYRMVNDWDIMTKLPPFWLGFRHIGKVIQLGNPWDIFSSFKSWGKNSHTQHAYRRNLDVLLKKELANTVEP